MPTTASRGGRLTAWVTRRATPVIGAALMLTALLAVPFLTMQPTSSASQEPGGEEFAARDLIEEEFASSVFTTFLVVEDRNGDLLTADALRALLAAEEALWADPDLGPTLFTYFDSEELVVADTEALRVIAELAEQREEVDAALVEAVRSARAAHRSWSEIGAMLGVSKQAAQRKYSKLVSA